MFSLIITIISIALVAALAVASVYYGGDAFSRGTAAAAASTLVTQGQQIAGAYTLYKADHAGARPTDLATLESENYLSAIPAMDADVVGTGETWELVDVSGDGSGPIVLQIQLAEPNEDLVSEINKLAEGSNQYGVEDLGEGDFVFRYSL